MSLYCYYIHFLGFYPIIGRFRIDMKLSRRFTFVNIQFSCVLVIHTTVSLKMKLIRIFGKTNESDAQKSRWLFVCKLQLAFFVYFFFLFSYNFLAKVDCLIMSIQAQNQPRRSQIFKRGIFLYIAVTEEIMEQICGVTPDLPLLPIW